MISRLDRHLKARLRDLDLLNLDLQCRPFSSDPSDQVSELVIAVDWSEVHAYVYGESAPPNDPLGELLRDDGKVPGPRRTVADSADAGTGGPPSVTAQAAHQVAMSVLFERFPGEIILIPPYVDEMRHHVAGLKARAQDLLAGQWLSDGEKGVYELRRQSPAIQGLTAILEGLDLGALSVDDRYARFHEHLRSNQADADQLRAWVGSEFQELYVIARLSQLNVLPALAYLVNGDGEAGSGPRVQTLAQRHEPLARTFRTHPASEDEWRDALGALTKNGKTWGSTLIDARALAYLERLNARFSAEGKQLLFVTRSSDVIEVIRHHPGRFAALGDQYLRHSEDANEPGLNPASFLRSWRMFFELGLALGPDAKGPIPPELQHTIVSHREAVRAYGRRLNRPDEGEFDALMDDIRREFDRGFQNRRAFVSTAQPYLPRPRTDADELDLAANFFVRFVTSEAEFRQLRRDIYEDLQRQLATWNEAVTRAGWDRDASQDERWVTRAILRDAPAGVFTQDTATGTDLAGPLAAVYAAVRDGQMPDDPETFWQMAKELPDTPGDDPVVPRAAGRTGDLLQIRLLTLFGMGAMGVLRTQLASWGEWIDQLPLLSQGWLVGRLLEADVRLSRNDYLNGDGVLRRAFRDAERGSASALGRPIHFVLLLAAWLRLHLYWIEQEKERVDNFPADPENPRRFEIEFILDQVLKAAGPVPDPVVLGEPLARMLLNQMIYAATRLTPIVEVEQSGTLYNVGGRRATWFKDQYLLRVAEPLAERLAGQPGLVPEELDTLAYFYLKRGYWRGEADGRSDWREARSLIEQAYAEPHQRSQRNEVVLTQHLRLLVGLETLLGRGDH